MKTWIIAAMAIMASPAMAADLPPAPQPMPPPPPVVVQQPGPVEDIARGVGSFVGGVLSAPFIFAAPPPPYYDPYYYRRGWGWGPRW